MRRLTLGGVPSHPALVHFPVVFWVLAPALDVAYAIAHDSLYWRLSWICALAGGATAVPAILAGVLDAVACAGARLAEPTLWHHAGLMGLTWSLFALACVFSAPNDTSAGHLVGVALHFCAVPALLAGAHAGGMLAHVYRLPAICTETPRPERSRA